MVCRRSSTVRATKSTPSTTKIVWSGQNVMLVPVSRPRLGVSPTTVILPWGLPPSAYSWRVVLAVAVDLDDESLGQRVDHRHADAVQTTGHLVAVAAELAAGVQHGEHHLGGALALVFARVERVDRDTATVVVDPAPTVGEQRDADARAVAGHRLVDGVVDDFPDQVMQTLQTGRADVHARALADGIEALEHLDRPRRRTRPACSIPLGFRGLRDAVVDALAGVPESPSGAGSVTGAAVSLDTRTSFVDVAVTWRVGHVFRGDRVVRLVGQTGSETRSQVVPVYRGGVPELGIPAPIRRCPVDQFRTTGDPQMAGVSGFWPRGRRSVRSRRERPRRAVR